MQMSHGYRMDLGIPALATSEAPVLRRFSYLRRDGPLAIWLAEHAKWKPVIEGLVRSAAAASDGCTEQRFHWALLRADELRRVTQSDLPAPLLFLLDNEPHFLWKDGGSDLPSAIRAVRVKDVQIVLLPGTDRHRIDWMT